MNERHKQTLQRRIVEYVVAFGFSAIERGRVGHFRFLVQLRYAIVYFRDGISPSYS